LNRNRENGKGRGVAAFIKNGLNWKRRYDLERKNIECMWIEIFINNSKNLLLLLLSIDHPKVQNTSQQTF